MDGESNAFLRQILEVERAVESLTRSGKLYCARPPNHAAQNYAQQQAPGQARYPSPSQYGQVRSAMSHSGREYAAPRGSHLGMRDGDYGSSTYPPPPPLQQQYAHSQQQTVYPGPPSAVPMVPYDGLALSRSRSRNDSGSGLHSLAGGPAQHGRPEAAFTYGQSTGSSTPFGNSTVAPPLTRLNSGSSQSTSHSIGVGMSSSMSMLPPGYGRDGYGSIGASAAHSRAHSIAGSLSGLTSTQTGPSHHRGQSISQNAETNHRASTGNLLAGGASVFNNPSLEHSRAGSLSGSANSPSPSTAAFNFFSGPLTSSHSGTSIGQVNSPAVQSNLSRIAPIGRPNQSKAAAGTGDSVGTSRYTQKSASGSTSGVTSPLGNGFGDGWLDVLPTARAGASGSSTALNEAQRKSVQNVWND